MGGTFQSANMYSMYTYQEQARQLLKSLQLLESLQLPESLQLLQEPFRKLLQE
jgi:hypothetical protein